MYTSSLASRNGVGPQIPTNGLIGLFDFGNTKSYPGTGTTVYNLAPSGSFNASLYNSPTFVSNGAKSYMQFVQTNNTYLNYIVPKKGTSTTLITVLQLGATWSNGFPVGGMLVKDPDFFLSTNYNIRSLTQGDETSLPYAPTAVAETSTAQMYGAAIQPPTVGTVMYVFGNDGNTAFTSGYNSFYDNNFSFLPSAPTFLSETNLQGYLGGYPVGGGPSALCGDVNIYIHMLYTRLLTNVEILNIYRGLKTRYGLT